MPISISLLPSNVDGSGRNLIYAIATATVSGNYPSGGEILDFTTIADRLSSSQVVQVAADSQNGNNGYYVAVQGTSLNTWKLRAFAAGGGELTPGAAYTGTFPTDIIQLTITARKLQ